MGYTPLLRRIRNRKTNYRKRKAVLIGRTNFAVVRISSQNVQVQIIKPGKNGDQVLVSAHSRELLENGWKGARNNIPACYLTGLIAGKKALQKNVEECVLYTGDRSYSPRVAASVKGLLDAGVRIPIDEETIPPEDRLHGDHIVAYANDLKEKDEELYKTRFSGLLKEGFAPESISDNVEKQRTAVLGKQLETKTWETETKAEKAEAKQKAEKHKKDNKEKVKKKEMREK